MTVQELWARLPNELLRRVLFCTDIKTAIRCFATCRRMSLFLEDNQLWRQLYWNTFSHHPLYEHEWLAVYQPYYEQAGQTTTKLAIQWRLATKHRLLTEANWYHKRYVEYQHKVEIDTTTFARNVYLYTGSSGALLYILPLKKLQFVSPTRNNHVMPLYFSEGHDDTLPVTTPGYLRAMLGAKYIVVACSDRSTGITQLFVWRAGQQVPLMSTYVSPYIALDQLVDRWLLTSVDVRRIKGTTSEMLDIYSPMVNEREPLMPIDVMSDKTSDLFFEVSVINVETGDLIYQFRHVTSLSVHLQLVDNALRLFRICRLSSSSPSSTTTASEADTAEPTYWQWESWRYDGKRRNECRAKGTIELSHHYNEQVCSRDLTENRVLLTRAPFPVGSDDTYSVLEIDENQQSSTSTGTGQRLWTVAARNYDLALPFANRLVTFGRGEDCCLIDIETGEIRETYAAGSIDCMDYAVASLCVAQEGASLAIIDAKTGEKTMLVENLYDPRGGWGTLKSCVYYWHQGSTELRILDFNANPPLGSEMDKVNTAPDELMVHDSSCIG
ncbi:hypothetical protein BDF22DRAFT_739514 [Syncephalis plumigaleata]|nr:hypothetical protein BDF22DRAFT_739514 [Syncephalis plumigaleata]